MWRIQLPPKEAKHTLESPVSATCWAKQSGLDSPKEAKHTIGWARYGSQRPLGKVGKNLPIKKNTNVYILKVLR